MASEKKAPEGIALLFMYGDEDDEMEDVGEEEGRQEEDALPPASDTVAVKEGDDANDNRNEIVPRELDERGSNENSTLSRTFNHGTSSASATPQPSVFSPQQHPQPVASDLNIVQSQKARLTIVDYGHEEGAMSPENEEGEIHAADRVMYGEQLQSTDGDREKKSPGVARHSTPSSHATPPQSLEQIDQPELHAMNHSEKETEYVETEDTVMEPVEEQKDVDPFRFLPLPPKTKCSEELQEKIIKFLVLKKTTGRSFNAEVRNRKEYRNPDFLLHAVTYQDIDQKGSCFSKGVFDPHGYEKNDFHDEIEGDMRREMERREQERKKSQKLDLTSGGMLAGNVVPAPKIPIPVSGSTAVSGGMINVTQATADVPPRDGRQNKWSKWDKVDVEQNSMATEAQENFSAVGAHSGILSAAKAGSGYSAFAQQRRKEAEDRRSSDRKLERRS